MLAGVSVLIGLLAIAFQSGPAGVVALIVFLAWLFSQG
jgi:hypothetical protein